MLTQLDNEAKQQLEQRFTFISLLGKGSFGYVYQCIDKKDQQVYAVKIISKNNVKKSKIECLRQQAQILLNINHINIVKVYQFVQTNSCIFLRMEIVKNGTLQILMKNRWDKGKYFTDQQISKIMGSILRSVNHIHSVSIIHRDIKPQNILVPNQDSFDHLKMADFGLSTRLDFYYPKTATMKCGTMLYMAPQILCNYTYTKSVDIWSCSIIMFMLFKGKHPFYQSKMTTQQYKKKIQNVVFPSLQNNLAQDFISKISKVDAHQRYCTQQALKHPWITRNLDDEIPLSLHESYSGFAKSHQISHAIKICLIIKQFMGCQNNKFIIPPSYLAKKQAHDSEISLKFQRLKKKKSDKNIHSMNQIQMLFSKREEPKQRIHKKSAELEGDSPTILKLNQLFNSLFDKKSKNKQKLPTEGFQFHPKPSQQTLESPCIDEYKFRIQSAIQKAVMQFKSCLKPNKKRILPSKKDIKNKQQIYGNNLKDDSRISSDSGSNYKIRYKKRMGTALRGYD